MTIKEVSSVIDDINEWENPRGGSVFYVTAIFTDESVGSVGRKDHDAALEVQGLLRESIGVEQDFTLEPAGLTKTGREKFKIKGFGTPGGAATYTAPAAVQGGASKPGENRSISSRSRPPEHDVDASIRAAVALKAAVEAGANIVGDQRKSKSSYILDIAEEFDFWLAKKASEPASSAYAPPVVDASTSTSPAGVGSEQSSEAGTPVAGTPAAESSDTGGSPASGFLPRGTFTSEDREEGVESEGKEPAPSSHQHDWQPHPQLRGKLKCECGEMRNKASVEAE